MPGRASRGGEPRASAGGPARRGGSRAHHRGPHRPPRARLRVGPGADPSRGDVVRLGATPDVIPTTRAVLHPAFLAVEVIDFRWESRTDDGPHFPGYDPAY